MIPYLTVPDIHIGPLTIPAFTLLVLLGTVIGAGIAVRRAREFGLSRSTFDITMTLALVGGFLGAHLFSILLYAPNLLWTDGLLILAKVWRGMSSYGGLWGALLALSLYFGRLKQPWLVHADALAQGLVVG